MNNSGKRFSVCQAAVLGAVFLLSVCAAGPALAQERQIDGLLYEKSLVLRYAERFSVDYYSGKQTGASDAASDSLYRYISIDGGGDYLVVPEGGSVPEGLGDDAAILQQPLDSVYLAATSQMDFFDRLGLTGKVTLSGLEEDGWYSEKARAAMEDGSMVYAGKYSEPDYETIVTKGCSLAIEATMIYHKPQVKEMLERFGIPVMVEHSSYEEEPLGRSEWIRLYGALYGCEEEADRQFLEMEQKVQDVLKETGTDAAADAAEGAAGAAAADAVTEGAAGSSGADAGTESAGAGAAAGQAEDSRPSVAIFSISSAGTVTVYKSGGYVPKMITMAGGRYSFDSLKNDSAMSTMSIPMEDFYAAAKDADYLVYNSTIEGEIGSVAELEGKSSLLEEFRAVQEGNVWCMRASLFQQPTGIADFLVDLHRMIDGEDGGYTYLVKLR